MRIGYGVEGKTKMNEEKGNKSVLGEIAVQGKSNYFDKNLNLIASRFSSLVRLHTLSQ